MKRRIFATALALLMLTGCGVPAPSPSPSVTATSSATPAVTASPTPAITATPEPTPFPTPAPLLYRDSEVHIHVAAAYRPLAMRLYQRAIGATDVEADAAIQLNYTAQIEDSMYFAGERLFIAAQLPGESGIYLPTMSYLGGEYPNEVFESVPIALDALVILVSKDNAVDSVTEDQLKGILLGEITNWKEVGGADVPIVPYSPLHGGWTRAALTSVTGFDAYTVPNDGIFYDGDNSATGDIIDFSRSGVLAATTYAYATMQYRQTGFKMLAVDGVAPSAETIGNLTYKYTATVYSIINQNTYSDTSARAIFEYLKTEESRAFIGECGYITKDL